jgi:very-short-patch-repair endonuclease
MVKLRGREEYPIYYGAKPEILRLAGELRRSMTHSEKLMWSYLRDRRVEGFRFRRQHPINEFIVDFFCYEAKLAIEIDGSIHNMTAQYERDKERTKILERFGIRVIRFTNDEVEKNSERVIHELRKILRCKSVVKR